MNERTMQITAPHFCAGLVLADNRVTEAAPILRYMIGWPITRVWLYCHKKRWTYEPAEYEPAD